MLNRQRGRTFPLVIALAMTLSLLLAPFGHAASHDLAVPGPVSETPQDASSATAANHDHSHGHSHDDGWTEERHGPASHGHPAADHLHEVPAPVDFPAPVLAWCGGAPSIFPADFPSQGPSFPLERPPQA